MKEVYEIFRIYANPCWQGISDPHIKKRFRNQERSTGRCSKTLGSIFTRQDSHIRLYTYYQERRKTMTYSKKTDIKLSNQVAITGTGKRRVKAPSTASNQLLIDAPDTLKDAKTHQSRVELPASPQLLSRIHRSHRATAVLERVNGEPQQA
jgi:hypothetical protein